MPARQQTFRPPSSPSISLTFVPNRSGNGGVLVPTAAKAYRKSTSQAAPKSDLDSPSEDAGSLDSDTNTLSPVSVLPPTSFSNDHNSLELSALLPLQLSCTLKSSQAFPAPKLSQTDSCMSESFILNNSPFTGSANGAVCIGTPARSQNASVQQLQAGSPFRQFDSPAPGQLQQSRQHIASPPPCCQQFQPQPHSFHQSSPLAGSLSSQLLPGTGSYACASTGVPSLAMGHPVSPPPPPIIPPPDQSLTSPSSQYPLPQQPTANSTADFITEFDPLCRPMSSIASDLSMTSSAPSAPLYNPSDPTGSPRMGSHQAGPAGGPQGSLGGSHRVGLGMPSQPALGGPTKASSLPSGHRQYFRGSESALEGQTAPQSPLTFEPARCTSPQLCYSSAASSLSQSMQSQVLDLYIGYLQQLLLSAVCLQCYPSYKRPMRCTAITMALCFYSYMSSL